MSYLVGGPARNGTIQTLAYTSASSSSSSAFGAQSYALKLIATSACVYKVGDGSQTAVDDNTGTFLPANWVEIVQVSPGQQIAAIRKANNGLITGTDGTLWVVELTS